MNILIIGVLLLYKYVDWGEVSEYYVCTVGIVVWEIETVAKRGVDNGGFFYLDFGRGEDKVNFFCLLGGDFAEVVESVGRPFWGGCFFPGVV